MQKTYINHKPSDAGVTNIERIREVADYFQTQIENSAPASRERSLALTKLEECVMWAVKAVVLYDPESTAQIAAPTSQFARPEMTPAERQAMDAVLNSQCK